MRNRENSYKYIFILLLFFSSIEAFAKTNLQKFFEVRIFDGFFLIPNTYAYNAIAKKNKVATNRAGFAQYEKNHEPFLSNPGVISLGHISACDICLKQSSLKELNIEHSIKTKGGLTVIRANVQPPGTEESTQVIYIFDNVPIYSVYWGDLNFVDDSIEHHLKNKF